MEELEKKVSLSYCFHMKFLSKYEIYFYEFFFSAFYFYGSIQPRPLLNK